MRSSDPGHPLAALVLTLAGMGWSGTIAAASAASAPATPSYPAAGSTQCHADEPVLFSCEVGKKVVSLCGSGKTTSLSAITYRYGLPGSPELEYVANAANGHHFHGLVEPAAPNASVREVWFDNGATRYLLTTCEGGDCAYEAGLAVLRAGKVLSKSRCVRTSPDKAFFDTDMVDFGSDLAGSRSGTSLLQLGEEDNKLEEL